MTVGEKIKQKRLELNLSQDELAKKVGYKSRSSIQKIESARALPLKKVAKMAIALECSPGYLMGWEDELESFATPEEFELQWHRSGGGRHPIELSDDEYEIILQYRVAPEEDKEMAKRILSDATRIKEIADGDA